MGLINIKRSLWAWMKVWTGLLTLGALGMSLYFVFKSMSKDHGSRCSRCGRTIYVYTRDTSVRCE